MRILKAGCSYFALVFATGFVLGVLRVTLVVPRLGVRQAELLEMPLMLLASYLAARLCLRRFGPFTKVRRLALGMLALLLLVAAELGLTVAMGQGIGDYLASRDPVSGLAYLVALACFGVLPLLAERPTAPHPGSWSPPR